jgi:voltage-dependent calcium channel
LYAKNDILHTNGRAVVLINMFIAVVQENFEIAEEEKRKSQLRAFIRRADPKEKTETAINKWNPYRFFKAKPKTLAVATIPSELILNTKKSRVRDFMRDSDVKQSKVINVFLMLIG